VTFDSTTNTGYFPAYSADATKLNEAAFLAFNLTSSSNVKLLKEIIIPDSGMTKGIFFDQKTNSLIGVFMYLFSLNSTDFLTIVGSYSLESNHFERLAVFQNTFVGGGGGASGAAIGFDPINRVLIFPNFTNGEFVSINVDTKAITATPNTTAVTIHSRQPIVNDY